MQQNTSSSKVDIKHKNQEPQQSAHQDDGCEDCKREKQQNKILINMYQKLKNIESKVGKIKGDLTNHQQKTQQNYHTINKIHKNIEDIKSLNPQTHHTNHNLLGIQVASNVIQKTVRMKLEQQNKKLRADFLKMKQQNQLLKKGNINSFSRPASENFNQNVIKQIQNVKISTNNSSIERQSTIHPVSEQQRHFPKQNNYQQKHQKIRQSLPQKKSVLDSEFWLFSNEQNIRLQNELYKNMKNKRYHHQDTSTKNESNFYEITQNGKQQQFELPLLKKRSNVRQNNLAKLPQPTIQKKNGSQNKKLPSLSLNKKK